MVSTPEPVAPSPARQTSEDIRAHLERLARPLHYAMRHNFAQLPKLRDLESYVQHHVQALQSLELPPALAAGVAHLAQTVMGFDTLDLPEKRARLQQAEQLLTQLQAAIEPAVSQAPPSTPAAAPPTVPPAAPEDPLAQSIQYVRGVGPRRAALLAKLGLSTVNDMLWYLPVRYEDRRQTTPLGMLRSGRRETFCGRVVDIQVHHRPRGKAFTTLRLEDSSGSLTCKWFQARGLGLQERFPLRARVVGHSLITLNAYTGGREAVHPDLEVLEDDDAPLVHFGRLVPIYPLTAGLPQKSMRTLMHGIVDMYVSQVQETLPAAIREGHRLPLLTDTLRAVHFPDVAADLDALNAQATPFHERLIFEEFFLLELGLALRHRETQQSPRTVAYQQSNHLGEALKQHLPFHLTAAQQRVLAEILADMQRPFPMNRLIQGDVGSGKTVVAVLAMLMAVSNGFQAALMAPTEILAEQHLTTLHDLLRPLAIEVELLTGAIKGRSRQQLLERIARGEIAMLVGTHALLYDEVQFHRLGMIVVDEQHRFGVLQRATLRQKGLMPDVLVMTATPIPRTLAMTLYGDLDLSVIDELPPGRLPVKTTVLSAARRDRAYEAIRREVRKGHQAYIVYPLIEESETLDLGAAVAMASHLQHDVFPEYTVGLLHGRLSSEEKEAIMQAFVQGTLHILVSTTVIEVGVDVPNATVMLVENAERFGLAQLHQLRGRVGRDVAQATCILLTGDKLSKEGRQRLRVMEESTDGFYVAEQDLQIRGPGELLGTRQAGLPELRVGNVLHHGILLEQARQAAFALLEADPDLQQPEHQALVMATQTRWGRRFELATIG